MRVCVCVCVCLCVYVCVVLGQGSPGSHVHTTTQILLDDMVLLETLMRGLENTLHDAMKSAVATFLCTARTEFKRLLEAVEEERASAMAEVEEERASAMAEVEEERASAMAEVEEERASAMAEVEEKREALDAELVAMTKFEQARDSRVMLNVGGQIFYTSVATLTSKPGTMLSAMLSGRYAVETAEDGSVFIDRDGDLFHHVLDYVRDGIVSVAEEGAAGYGDVQLLRKLKREFGFFAIELVQERELTFAVGGSQFGCMNALQTKNGLQPHMECYDAADDTWREVAPMNKVTHKVDWLHVVSVIAGELYALGGSFFDAEAMVQRYNVATDTWSAVDEDVPAPIHGTTACAVGGSMYVLGGRMVCALSNYTTNVFRYESSTDTWCEMAPMPERRTTASVCVVGSDIYVCGGNPYRYVHGQPQCRQTSSVFRYSTDTDEWITLAPMPDRKSNATACTIGGMVFVIGGEVEDDRPCSSVFKFDPASGEWSTLAPMSRPRSRLSSFAVDGCIYAVGGYEATFKDIDEAEKYDPVPHTAEKYDPATDSWSVVSPMHHGRHTFSAVAVKVEVNLFDVLISKALKSGRAP
jgi:N-acetylneuraminic acid mutarotase